MTIKLCCRLFVTHSFHFGNVFSTLATTDAHLQSLFAHFASTKLNISAADITRMLKIVPKLQRLQTLHEVEQFVHMFNKRGLTEVQIARVMRTQPSLMVTNNEKILEPKIKLLEDFGVEGQNLARVLTKSPSILGVSLKNDLLPKMEFLKSVFQSQDSLIRSLIRHPVILRYNLEKTLKPSVAFWEEWGFRGTGLSRFLRIEPGVLSRTSLTPAHVDLIHKIGADKESKMFKFVVSTVAVSRMETLEAKIENLKLCGLSAEEVWQLLGANPRVLCLSKESVNEKMNFLVNNMELPVNYVMKHPSLLIISLEKVMRPRFLVLQKIKSINDLGFSLITVLMISEARFVSKIIEGHPESETLWTIYENAISNASN